MSLLRLVFASFRFWFRAHVAIALGLVTAVAVWTGAGILGESLRGSLARLALERLGPVCFVFRGQRFFSPGVAEQLERCVGFEDRFEGVAPLSILSATLRYQAAAEGKVPSAISVGEVQVIACDERFWRLWKKTPLLPRSQGRQAFLNQALATRIWELSGETLRVRPGDRIFLRLQKPATVPAESLFGNRRESSVAASFAVAGILPDNGPGNFTLQLDQRSPLNIFLPLEALEWLGLKDQCNVLVIGTRAEQHFHEEQARWLAENCRLDPEACGLRIERSARGYLLVGYDGYFFPPQLEAAVTERLSGFRYQPILTYLANQIRSKDRMIPYSLVAAIDPDVNPPLGPLVIQEGRPLEKIPPNTVVLNDWAAEDLGVVPGDVVTLRFFRPESQGGKLLETEVDLPVSAVVKLAEAAADPLLTPQIPGVTEKESIRDWDAPFEPFHPEWIRIPNRPGPGNDEDYWHRFGTTPKAFVSLETGRALWENRFGRTSGFRIDPVGGVTEEELRKRLSLSPTAAGYRIEAIRAQALRGAVGAASFAGLFLGLSGFVVTAGVILAVLFLSLTLAQRQREIGILMALGFRPSLLRVLYGLELSLTAVLSCIVGVLVGVGYAALLIEGFHRWWLPAIGEPVLRLELGLPPVILGLACGLGLALVGGAWSLRGMARRLPVSLLRGVVFEWRPEGRQHRGFGVWVFLGVLAFALAWGFLALGLAGESSAEERAGWFFGAGVTVLIAIILIVWKLLAWPRRKIALVTHPKLAGLAWLNLCRNPGRTLATITILALAVFLLVSVSIFRLEPDRFLPGEEPGSGGYVFIVETALPVFADWTDPDGLSRSVSRAEAATIHGELPGQKKHQPGKQTHGSPSVRFVAFRLRGGEDASCLNLYRVEQPRMLGVAEDFIDHGRFRLRPWVECTPQEADNPWLLLRRTFPPTAAGQPVLPAIVDEVTALYALGLARGQRQLLSVTDSRGNPLHLLVVAVLRGSIFQGFVLLREADLLRFFPEVNGYRLFLVEMPGFSFPNREGYLKAVRSWRRVLEEVFVDYGGRVETTAERLSRLAAVQNTYLATFQTLGGLGLLLGGIGLGAVQLRNIFERRRELALLRAIGFRKQTLIGLVVLEMGWIIALGLTVGILPGAIAVAPSVVAQQASLPLPSLALALGVTLLAGAAGGAFGIAALLRVPFLEVLRRE
jgi:putative ABC transport system permease protein